MKTESSAAGDKLAITPSTVHDHNKSDSSRSQECSSEEKTKFKENTKNIRKTRSEIQSKDNISYEKSSKNDKVKEENNGTGDKSERSSSPAFDSDEDSVGFGNQQQEQTTTTLCVNKKRAPSIAGILVNTAHSSFFSSKLTNSNSREQETNPLQKVQMQTKNFREEKNQCAKEIKSISLPVTPEYIEASFVTSNEEQEKDLTKVILTSPSSLIEKSRPHSIISDGESSKDLLDDFVSRLDGADLRFMEESSGMLSPTNIDSPPANFPIYRQHNVNNQNNNIVTNPSLLQKALIQATAQTKHPSPTVLIKSFEQSNTSAEYDSNRFSPSSSMNNKNHTVSIMKSSNQQQNLPSQQFNKLTLEVSVTDRKDNKPVTTIKIDTSCAKDIMTGDSEDKNTSSHKNVVISSHDDDDDDENILSLDQISTCKTVEGKNNASKLIDKESSAKKSKSILQRVRKTLRLNGKKKSGPLLSFVGNRQKSKSENRARKAFRTISFILGAFVICWTPYHILVTKKQNCSVIQLSNILNFV